MSYRSSHTVPPSPSLGALADAIHKSLRCDDIPRTVHLSWLLMQQPHCPIQLQAQAVLVNSAASLTLGGDLDIIETNLQNMAKRLSGILSKMPKQGAEAPWNVKALGQLQAALAALRGSRYNSSNENANAYQYRRGYHHHHHHHAPSSKPACLDLDELVAGFGKMGLGTGTSTSTTSTTSTTSRHGSARLHDDNIVLYAEHDGGPWRRTRA